MKNDINWKRCKNYHWFDGSKYRVCPQCEGHAVDRSEKRADAKKEKVKRSEKTAELTQKKRVKNTEKSDVQKSAYNEDILTEVMGVGNSSGDIDDLTDENTQSMFDL